MKYVVLLLGLLCISCPSRGYPTRFAKLTKYKIFRDNCKKTPEKVLYQCPGGGCDLVWQKKLDKKVREVESCIGMSVNRDWFMVYIPTDWWTSKCTGQQMVPSAFPIWKGCELYKNIKIPVGCREILKPTEQCPCPCAFRAVIQDHWAIVTTPNLYIFKSELIRIVTGENNPWVHPKYQKCLP